MQAALSNDRANTHPGTGDRPKIAGFMSVRTRTGRPWSRILLDYCLSAALSDAWLADSSFRDEPPQLLDDAVGPIGDVLVEPFEVTGE